jgi:hypothetical protein
VLILPAEGNIEQLNEKLRPGFKPLALPPKNPFQQETIQLSLVLLVLMQHFKRLNVFNFLEI